MLLHPVIRNSLQSLIRRNNMAIGTSSGDNFEEHMDHLLYLSNFKGTSKTPEGYPYYDQSSASDPEEKLSMDRTPEYRAFKNLPSVPSTDRGWSIQPISPTYQYKGYDTKIPQGPGLPIAPFGEKLGNASDMLFVRHGATEDNAEDKS